MKIILSIILYFSIHITAHPQAQGPIKRPLIQQTLGEKIHKKLHISLPRGNNFLKSFGLASQEAIPQTFRLLVWNIYKGQKNGLLEELKRYSHTSDLILLQEAYLDNAQLSFYTKIKNQYRWDMAQSFFKGQKQIPTGVITGHKSKNITVRPLRSPMREPLLGTPKTALLNKFKLAGGDQILCVLNIHAINFVTPTELKKHLLQIEKVLKPCHGPIIYAGDFNTWLDRKYEILLASTKKLGLKPVNFASGQRSQLTPFSPPFDHIFIRGLKVLKSHIIYWSKTSDHMPLSITLKAD